MGTNLNAFRSFFQILCIANRIQICAAGMMILPSAGALEGMVPEKSMSLNLLCVELYFSMEQGIAWLMIWIKFYVRWLTLIFLILHGTA